MTTYQTAFLSEVSDMSNAVSAGTRAYLQERFRNRLYDLVVNEFIKRQQEDPNFTQAALARRIGKRPEQITRWLSYPGNLTSDTISDLLVGIAGAELQIGVDYFAHQARMNYIQPEWLAEPQEKVLIIYQSTPKTLKSMVQAPLILTLPTS
jgi:hypothetical protein